MLLIRIINFIYMATVAYSIYTVSANPKWIGWVVLGIYFLATEGFYLWRKYVSDM